MDDGGGGPVPEELGAEECMTLISPGGVGRVGFCTATGPLVLPVNYTTHEGGVLFRTAFGGPMDEQLDTGVRGVEFKVAFEVDRIDTTTREGWSVLVQGAAHRIAAEDELTAAKAVAVEPWAGGERRLYIRISPVQITGRRIRHP
ncbi:pyridoxamine 5'-phosphate oxidase family protein [Sphaerisporangium album]|uniref:Pyridoxamine 5'-phosphate oxidase family protein n=1 Tax=Sphaerisporangium album TaxID=509200 RepID=A0A367FFX6_9ACTN|nr:pyridoxamine 5'-phosphate oxidase family protein [Sphaerisporangium album]RCG28597.1 pyridoxamine 5'-phosphate oxidase family protein [Sphaerisporangium album]